MSTRCREVRCEVLTAVLLKFLARHNACWAGDVQHRVLHTAQHLCSLLLALVSFVFMYTKSLHAATLHHMFISTPALTAHCPFIWLTDYLSTDVRTSPNMNIFYPFIYLLTQRVIHELWALLYGIFPCDWWPKTLLSTCAILSLVMVLSLSRVQWREPRVTCWRSLNNLSLCHWKVWQASISDRPSN